MTIKVSERSKKYALKNNVMLETKATTLTIMGHSRFARVLEITYLHFDTPAVRNEHILTYELNKQGQYCLIQKGVSLEDLPYTIFTVAQLRKLIEFVSVEMPKISF